MQRRSAFPGILLVLSIAGLTCLAVPSISAGSSPPACPVTETGLPITLLFTSVMRDTAAAAPGSVLCVLDLGQDSLAVGTAEVTGQTPLAVTAWQGDPGHGLPGAACGNEMGFELWDSGNDKLYKWCDATYTRGDSLFCSDSYTVIEVRFFIPTGACCAGNGYCAVRTSDQCAASGGSWLGAEVPCDPNPCPAACCFAGQLCQLLDAAACASQNGHFKLGHDCSNAHICEEEPAEKSTWGRIKNGYR